MNPVWIAFAAGIVLGLFAGLLLAAVLCMSKCQNCVDERELP